MNSRGKELLRVLAYSFYLAKHQAIAEGLAEGTPEYKRQLTGLRQQYQEWSEADLVTELNKRDFSLLLATTEKPG